MRISKQNKIKYLELINAQKMSCVMITINCGIYELSQLKPGINEIMATWAKLRNYPGSALNKNLFGYIRKIEISKNEEDFKIEIKVFGAIKPELPANIPKIKNDISKSIKKIMLYQMIENTEYAEIFSVAVKPISPEKYFSEHKDNERNYSENSEENEIIKAELRNRNLTTAHRGFHFYKNK